MPEVEVDPSHVELSGAPFVGYMHGEIGLSAPDIEIVGAARQIPGNTLDPRRARGAAEQAHCTDRGRGGGAGLDEIAPRHGRAEGRGAAYAVVERVVLGATLGVGKGRFLGITLR